MNLHFSYRAGKPSDLEKEIPQYVHKLERYLQAFRPDLVHLHGAVVNGPPDSVGVSLNLRLPTGQLNAQESAATAAGAAKIAFDDLLQQLKKHKELLRSEHKWRRQRPGDKRPVSSLEQATPRSSKHAIEPSSAAEGQTEAPQVEAPQVHDGAFDGNAANLFQSDVRSYINANLDRLQRFVERELQNRTPPENDLSASEIVDEVVVAALSAEQGPTGLSMEKWMYRLAIQAIQRLTVDGQPEGGRFVPLGQNVNPPNVTGSDEALLQYHQPGEVMHLEDVIPDRANGTPEDVTFNDEVIEQLESALRGASRQDREAFVLSFVEGFTLKEISQVTDRPLEEVKRSVETAKDQVFRKLPPTNVIKKRLQQHSSVA